VENLHVEFKEKIRERWNSGILRSIIPTSDFAQPSEESIGDTHKKIAKAKRTNETDGQGLTQINGGGPMNVDNDLLKIED